jgi:dTDP-4-amino-4,6-dideoxygalactose transaminase
MTIPAAPLPSIGELAFSLLARPSTGKTWQASGRDVLLYDRGASALTEAVRAVAGEDPSRLTLWIPDYMCSEALTGVRGMNVGLRFYPINRELSPDWEWLARAVGEHELPQALVVVNYFGLCDSLEAALLFCGSRRVTLIEDAAHVLRSDHGGGLRHLVVFSPRKLFAIPAGGGMMVPVGWPAIVEPRGVESAGTVISWLIKRLLQSLMRTFGISWHRFRSESEVEELPIWKGSRRLSKLSRKILAMEERHVAKVALLRRANYRQLAAALHGCERIHALVTPVSAEATPYVFPLWVSEDIAGLRRHLVGNGIPASRWPDLPPEVLADPGVHRNALELYEHILLLPVHQTLSSDDLSLIAAKVTEFESDRRASV